MVKLSLLSKVVFSIGISLILSAISAIYITAIANQNNNNNTNQNSSSTNSNNSSTLQQQGNSSNTNSQSQSQSGAGTSLKDNTIIIPQGAQNPNSGNYYNPSNAVIQPNSKITFKNEDSVIHTATADDGSFDTGNIPIGSSKSVTVKGQETIPYHCTIHPWMKAKLTVSSPSSSFASSYDKNSSNNNSNNNNNNQ